MKNEGILEMAIQLLGRGEPTINDADTKEQKWNYYIQSYTMVTPTEGVNVESENYKAPFLKRNLRNLGSAASAATLSTQPAEVVSDVGPSGARTPRESTATSPATVSIATGVINRLSQVAEGCLVSKHNLELKVCVNTYKLFYGRGTEDYMLAKGWFSVRDVKKEKRLREKRVNKWTKWLEAGTKWVKELGGEDSEEVKEVKRKWVEWSRRGIEVAAAGEGGDVEMVTE